VRKRRHQILPNPPHLSRSARSRHRCRRWDHASDIAKAIVTRDIFISQVSAARASMGAVTSRKLDTVTSSVYNGQGTSGGGPIVPAGTYINVVFATQFANSPKTVHELVSFHLDPDQHWRVTGYTLR
jgi:hypothetical protein